MIDVWWINYELADWWGLIDPDEYEKPEAYVIYRSFDGENWEKIGVAGSNAIIYRDPSPQLEPGKRVWYKVSSWYPDGESTPVMLGSVVPLDNFNVILLEPKDGDINVSRDPIFMWMPDKELTSPEGTVTYEYAIWLYDLVQSETHIIPYDPYTFLSIFIQLEKKL